MSEHPEDALALEEPIVAPKGRPKTQPQDETATRNPPPYHVVILDDDEHTFDYVIEMLGRLFGHPKTVGRELAWTIHTKGRAVVYTTHKEKAELKRDQVLAYGPDPALPGSPGSMRCYIEPAPTD
ncbi:MAG: ATP-dependent Clp protease adaptor ClpS [Isosphaeraceae bacterium]|nr:ATP-dependent Clp protease adaptor ClpS [Isosphaeraceae bacterium]